MNAYSGEGLPEKARIAVVANDALGNFVVSTPLLQMLRARHPLAKISYFGGTRTLELESASDLIDQSIPIHGRPMAGLPQELLGVAGAFDLVINLERSALAMAVTPMLVSSSGFVAGPSLSSTGRASALIPKGLRQELSADPDWMSVDLRSKYPFLDSGFIGEIFCRIAYLDGPIPRYQVPVRRPTLKIPDVLISTAASSADKLWTKAGWTSALNWLKDQGFSAGLIGASPNLQREFWKGESVEDELVSANLVEDLRGAFTLPEVVGALDQARFVLTLDNGILHLAAATNTPTLGLFRNGIHRLWAPPQPNISVLEPGPGGVVTSLSSDQVIDLMKASLKPNARYAGAVGE